MELSIPKTHSVNVCNKVGLMQINKGLSTQHLTVSSLPLQQWTGLVFFFRLVVLHCNLSKSYDQMQKLNFPNSGELPPHLPCEIESR